MEGGGEVRNRKKAKNGSFSRFTFSRLLPPMHFRKEKKISFDPLEDAATVEKEKCFGEKIFLRVSLSKVWEFVGRKTFAFRRCLQRLFLPLAFFCHFPALKLQKREKRNT